MKRVRSKCQVHECDACRADERWAEGDAVLLGFGDSIRDDATALLACSISDRLFLPIGIWESPEGPDGRGWGIDRIPYRTAHIYSGLDD